MCLFIHKTIRNYPNIFYICCNLFIRQNGFKAVKPNPTIDVVAYWPEGKAICLFLGPTPISKDGKILAYSPANVVGKILDPHLKDDWLDKVETNTNVIIE